MMRVDFALNPEEVYTVVVRRTERGFLACWENLEVEANGLNEAVDRLGKRMKRHFLKLRCISLIKSESNGMPLQAA